ncbi:hypothetical protein LP416_02250 [Polaromonas sp. P2-4]|nr:hypothetical protein LP416_02250 [Polaromonas sp. P2-4]
MPTKTVDSSALPTPQAKALHPDPTAPVGGDAHRPTISVSCNATDAAVMPEVVWQPRVSASHLAKGPNGIWYFRLAIPARVRALNPKLPKEIRRSTRTGNRCHALAIS